MKKIIISLIIFLPFISNAQSPFECIGKDGNEVTGYLQKTSGLIITKEADPHSNSSLDFHLAVNQLQNMGEYSVPLTLVFVKDTCTLFLEEFYGSHTLNSFISDLNHTGWKILKPMKFWSKVYKNKKYLAFLYFDKDSGHYFIGYKYYAYEDYSY